jgi:hypothetical protein
MTTDFKLRLERATPRPPELMAPAVVGVESGGTILPVVDTLKPIMR